MENRKDFTYDKDKFTDLPNFADYLHANGQKYIIILVSLKRKYHITDLKQCLSLMLN